MSVSYLYISTIGFLLGILLSNFLNFSLSEITSLLFFGLIFILLWYQTINRKPIKHFLFLSILLVSFSLGALRFNITDESFNSNSDLSHRIGDQVTLVGKVSAEPDQRLKNTLFKLKAGNDSLLVSVDKYQDVFYGDVVEVVGILEEPESFETDLGRTFDYPGYLKAKGIKYQISFAEIKTLETNKGNFLITELLQFKHAFMTNLELVIREPAAALGEGLLLGVKQSMGAELESAFRKTGIIHIVVLSGYNIMLVVLFVMFIFGYFLSPQPRIVAGIISIILFAILVGLSASVLRASIMAAILLLVQATGRVYLALRGLVLAGVIMVLINPYVLVYDVGFQLSFLATLGLILIAPILDLVFRKIPKIIGLRGFVIATVSTQIAVLPLLLYSIGEFSVIAVLVNVLVLPMVPVAMLLTFITGLLAFVSLPLSSLVAVPTYFSLTYINTVALWFAELPFASFVVPSFPFVFVILAYVLLSYTFWYFYQRNGIDESYFKSETAQVLQIDPKLKLSDWIIEEEFDTNKK